jgi:hypothetical protein
LLRDIVCLRNICVNTLHKGDSDDDDDNNNVPFVKRQAIAVKPFSCKNYQKLHKNKQVSQIKQAIQNRPYTDCQTLQNEIPFNKIQLVSASYQMNAAEISPKARLVRCDTKTVFSFGVEVKKVSINLHSVVIIEARGRMYVRSKTPCPGTGPSMTLKINDASV